MPKVAWLQSVHLNHGLADAMRDTRDQGIAHAEGSMAIGHAGVGPALRESLELVELVGDKTTETTVGALDDMLKTAGSRAAFAREDGAARFVGSIREAHGSLGVRVRKARLFVGALLALAALKVAPVGELFVRDVELLRNIRLVDKHIAKHAALAVIVLSKVAGQNVAALHDTGVLELRGLYGETDRQIAEQYGLEYTGNKAQWTTLVYRMLGIKSNAAEEFVKAGINVRACRVNKRGHIEQAMSFPPFEFKQLINEDWETSSFRARLETSRFFFVVFHEDHEGMWRLDRCLFWAMPANEIEGPAKACWDETRKVIRKGVELNPYRDASGKLKVTNNLSGMADNPIVHVRPHTSKAAYKFADGTEIGDIARNAYELPDGRWMTRQSFWFNKGYLEHILGL